MAANRRRLLIVDDDADGRVGLAEVCRLWGYEVDAAEDGRAGIEVALRCRPDIAVVDLGLPDGDGYNVVVRLKAAGAVVIAWSGWSNRRTEALEAGADFFVLKPDLPELERVLAGVGSAPRKAGSGSG